MLPMSDPYQELLSATIQHLEELKSEGVRFVPVSAETLARLSQRHRPSPGPSSLPAATTSSRVIPHSARPEPISAPTKPAEPGIALPGEQRIAAPARALSPEAKAAAFTELRERALACVKCAHLASTRKNVVFGVGNINADLMFVGEAPGADEDQQAEPFVGKAGQLLTRIIQTMGLRREDVYIANILKCRPDMPPGAPGNRKPTPQEMETCIPFLHEQIDLIRPKVLVALGATAVEGLLGKAGGINKLRGHWASYRGVPLMPTFHPAYLLRNQAMTEKRKVWEDMLQVMEKLGMLITEKQRKYFLS